tara:strand:+ start:159 stop:830 length:672 start_codon:yes stop_codon:yes gene_type:complete
MKKIVFTVALATITTLGFVSCKNQAKEAETTEAQEVASTPAVSEEYTVSMDASEIQWKGTKPTGSHNGTVNVSEGTVVMKDERLEAGKFVIDMTSIVSLDAEGDMKQNLEAHLKGTVEGKEGDFFNVNTYPTASFALTGVKENEEGKAMIEGNLTIKDKTNNITFPATVTHEGKQVVIQSEPFSIDRTKWGVNYGSKSIFDNLGDKFINDDIELTVKVVANRE